MPSTVAPSPASRSPQAAATGRRETDSRGSPGIRASLRRNWPEYLMEAWGLGMFMISAGLVVSALEWPGSSLHPWIPDPDLRRVLVGIAMGLTAICLIHSPWGKRSGAHLNPAVTLTFWRLGKVRTPDALFYVLAQFAGGTAGVLICAALLGPVFRDPPVSYVATLPGGHGATIAFAAEVLISAILMLVVLASSASPRFGRFTGAFAGLLVATYISIEAPLSGMSMNPARSFASAAPGGLWDGFWIYVTAPPLGMLLAAELFVRARGGGDVRCAKLDHSARHRCIHCGYLPPTDHG